ncbi:MAG: Hsp20 family protein [Alphaproteobacteria bacterium]
MTEFDLSPLFRSTVGFDRLSRLLDSAFVGNEAGPAYPPYNIEKCGENRYRIVMAVAGFREDDIDVTAAENVLTVAGRGQTEDAGETPTQYLYRGIARRAFERRFQLADHIEVSAAELKDGLLSIELVREVPEAMKPRRIAIRSAAKPAIATGKAA